jgi:hypothetical protein
MRKSQGEPNYAHNITLDTRWLLKHGAAPRRRDAQLKRRKNRITHHLHARPRLR